MMQAPKNYVSITKAPCKQTFVNNVKNRKKKKHKNVCLEKEREEGKDSFCPENTSKINGGHRVRNEIPTHSNNKGSLT